jgi:hypothetical protein
MDPEDGVIRYPVRCYLPIKKRTILPNRQDLRNPIRAKVILRRENDAAIVSNLPRSPGGDVTLPFGIQLDVAQIYPCSAEEHRGQPLFSATFRVTEIDFELRDEGRTDWVNDA